MDKEDCQIKRRVNSSRKRRRDPTGTTPAKGKIARQIHFIEGRANRVQASLANQVQASVANQVQASAANQECPGTPEMLFQDEDCTSVDPQDSFNSSDTLFAQMNLSNLQESESANQMKESTCTGDDVIHTPVAVTSSHENHDRNRNTGVQEEQTLSDGPRRTNGKAKAATDHLLVHESKHSTEGSSKGNLKPSCKSNAKAISGNVLLTSGQGQQSNPVGTSFEQKESGAKSTETLGTVREKANAVPTKVVKPENVQEESCPIDDLTKHQTSTVAAIKSTVSTPKPRGSLRDRIKQALQTNIKNTTPQATKTKQMRDESVTKVISAAMETYEKTSEYDVGPFYGLPSRVKELLIQHRGIGKLYDWQNECLTLDTVQKRGNLIYSLPTSGGKTLVAEILIMKEILSDLDFVVEEYAGSRGGFPPRKRRHKHALYVATIEKANSLVNSLVELGRLQEIGLVVVDELHMLGEGGSRGATLEMCLAKVLYISNSTQIIGMSATLNNIQELQTFLSAEVYSNNFRPVQLKEYVKIADSIFEVNSKASCPDEQIQFSRMVSYKYPREMQSRDPDHLVGMVMDVIPAHSCLVFCPTKKNCQNVVDMLCKLLPRKLRGHKVPEKKALLKALGSDGSCTVCPVLNYTVPFGLSKLRGHKVPEKKALLKALESDGSGTVCPVLKYTVPFGLAYHHSGLTMDERRLIEEAYSEGVLCLLACTSTLAAGVNLPAKRVILRAPFVGADFISRAQYKQMVGRAGRAGIDSSGESVTIVKPQDKAKMAELIGRPFESCRSSLMYDDGKGLKTLILNLIGLKIATSKEAMSAFLSHTLFSVQCDSQQDQNFLEFTQNALQHLVEVGLVTEKTGDGGDTLLEVTRLGQASFKGPIDIKYSSQLYQDLCKAQEALVVENSLHMLYLVTPYDMVVTVRPNWMIYFRQLSQLKPIELKAAAIIGVPEGFIARKASGQRARQTSVEEAVVNRFYLTLMIYSLMKQHNIWDVSEKFDVPRGFLQNLLSSAASFCACVLHFCEALEEMWPLRVLLDSLVKSLSYCVTSELIPLMEVSGVKQGRARQLYSAGYKTIQDLAHAEAETLVQTIQHMPRKVAYQIIAAAKVLISERAESLLEEAEDLVAMPTDGVVGSVAMETDAVSLDGWSQDSQNQRWSQVSAKEPSSQ
ncbi:hypothetical protein Bbelb_092700 [Branchiostoma belcheri]|nr:hypothetical protein Bbelb_092700 [Branchiostoma belcheri]